MGRNLGAVLAGIVVVFVVVTTLQYGISLLYPLPEGLDPFDPASAEVLAEHMQSQPPIAWLLALVSEIVGVFLGAWAAGSIAASRTSLCAGIIVAVGVAGSVMNWLSFSHPIWFIVAQLVAYPLVFVAVSRIVRGDA